MHQPTHSYTHRDQGYKYFSRYKTKEPPIDAPYRKIEYLMWNFHISIQAPTSPSFSLVYITGNAHNNMKLNILRFTLKLTPLNICFSPNDL